MDRSGFAPGEQLTVRLRTALTSSGPEDYWGARRSPKEGGDILSEEPGSKGRAVEGVRSGVLTGDADCFLIQEVSRWEGGRKDQRTSGSWRTSRTVVAARMGVALTSDSLEMPCPALPPSFEGMHPDPTKDVETESECDPDPVRWRYLVSVTLRLQMGALGTAVGLGLKDRRAAFCFPIAVCGLGLGRLAAPSQTDREGGGGGGDGGIFWRRPDLHPPLSCCALVPWRALLPGPGAGRGQLGPPQGEEQQADHDYGKGEAGSEGARLYSALLEGRFAAPSSSNDRARERVRERDRDRDRERDRGSMVVQGLRRALVREAEEDFGCGDSDSLLLAPCYLLSPP